MGQAHKGAEKLRIFSIELMMLAACTCMGCFALPLHQTEAPAEGHIACRN